MSGENARTFKMKVKIRVIEPPGKHGIRALNQPSPEGLTFDPVLEINPGSQTCV